MTAFNKGGGGRLAAARLCRRRRRLDSALLRNHDPHHEAAGTAADLRNSKVEFTLESAMQAGLVQACVPARLLEPTFSAVTLQHSVLSKREKSRPPQWSASAKGGGGRLAATRPCRRRRRRGFERCAFQIRITRHRNDVDLRNSDLAYARERHASRLGTSLRPSATTIPTVTCAVCTYAQEESRHPQLPTSAREEEGGCRPRRRQMTTSRQLRTLTPAHKIRITRRARRRPAELKTVTYARERPVSRLTQTASPARLLDPNTTRVHEHLHAARGESASSVADVRHVRRKTLGRPAPMQTTTSGDSR